MLKLIFQHAFPAQEPCHWARAERACPLGSEITRRIEVCVNLIVALFTLELGLLGPIAALSVPTTRAYLTGMSGIFFDHQYPSHRKRGEGTACFSWQGNPRSAIPSVLNG